MAKQNNVMTTVTLNEAQCVYVRQLLFEELHDAAEILADQAAGAAQGNASCDNQEGDDGASTFRNRVQVIAELLDTVGWSVETDIATIVELERKRQVA
jgi:hypothetical protein